MWRIGVEAPLTGDQATLGQGMLDGAQLAADQVNAQGGVLGRTIEVVPIDDAADADTGVAAATEAIDEGLVGVVGPYNSSVGLKTLPLYLEAGVIPIRLTSDNATDGMGFTLQPMTDQIAPVTATALDKFARAKTVGIMYDSTQAYTKSTSAAVKKQLEKAGVTVTKYLPVKPGTSSFAHQVSQITKGDPDAVYSAVYYPEGAKIAQAMASVKGTDCLLDYASYDSGYVADAGDAADRCDVVGVPAPADFPDSRKPVQAFTEQFGQAPGTWSPYVYDSLNFLLAGAEQAGSFDATAVSAALADVRDWTGWTGSVTIDAASGNRDPATVVVTSVNDGELRINPQWAAAAGADY